MSTYSSFSNVVIIAIANYNCYFIKLRQSIATAHNVATVVGTITTIVAVTTIIASIMEKLCHCSYYLNMYIKVVVTIIISSATVIILPIVVIKKKSLNYVIFQCYFDN